MAEQTRIQTEVYGMITDFCRTIPCPPIWIFPNELNPTKRLKDIGLDAAYSAELVFEIEERFRVNITSILREAELNRQIPDRPEGNYYELSPREIAEYVESQTIKKIH